MVPYINFLLFSQEIMLLHVLQVDNNVITLLAQLVKGLRQSMNCGNANYSLLLSLLLLNPFQCLCCVPGGDASF